MLLRSTPIWSGFDISSKISVQRPLQRVRNEWCAYLLFTTSRKGGRRWPADYSRKELPVDIRVGFDIACSCPITTPMVLMLSVHPERHRDLAETETQHFDSLEPVHHYVDSFGKISAPGSWRRPGGEFPGLMPSCATMGRPTPSIGPLPKFRLRGCRMLRSSI